MQNMTQPINPRNRTEQIGGAITRGGSIVVDEFFSVPYPDQTPKETSKWVVLGTGGTVLAENADGQIIPFIGHQTGDWIPVFATRIVSNYTDPNLGALTTTATDMIWYGGA